MQIIPRIKYENNNGGVPPQPQSAKDIVPIYPSHFKYTSDDPDDFLLWEHYAPESDTLFICYKSYSTGKRRIETIHNPKVPIFRSKRTFKYNQEVVRLDQTKKIFIPYINKTEELRNMFFNSVRIEYFDKHSGMLKEKFIQKDVPANAEYLHPELYGGDITLETWAIADYTLKRYQANHDKRLVEHIAIPDLTFGCFDIETVNDPDGVTRIHTNTFIDYKAKKAYLDYWERPDFNRVEELREHTDVFIQTFKKTLYNAIEECAITDAKKRSEIQALAHSMTDDLEVIVTPFQSEEELIKRTTYRMFTESDCDVLMAFNAPFDLGKFEERVQKLGLDSNTMSDRRLTKFKDYKGLYAQNIITRNGRSVKNGFISPKTSSFEFRGDQIYPSKRTVFLPILCDKLVVDTAVLYYSARQNSADVSSYSLDATAQRTLGFGKFDYSHITDSIVKLVKVDYFWHSVYALIDSVLLGIIDVVGSETKSALQYKFRTKTSIYETPSNNLAIPTCDIIDGYVMGYIFGNNINKILRSMPFKEIKQVEKVIGFDYTSRARDVKLDEEKTLSGGLISNPKLWINMSELVQEYNILEHEFNPTVFTLILYAAYLDFKSHYPNQKITRNAAVQTLIGVIIGILEPDRRTAFLSVPGFYEASKQVQHFGSLLLTMVNEDPIAYASLAGNLPSISELSHRFVQYDSEPIFNPINQAIQKTYKKPLKINNFLSFMSSLNRKKIPKEAESDVELKDNKFFLMTSGKMVYYGTLVEYRYNSFNVINYTNEQEQFKPNTESLYGYTQKDNLVIDNNFLIKPSRERYNIKKPFVDFPLEEFDKLSKACIFTEKIYLEGERFDLLDRNFYYPFFRFSEQLEGHINPNKDTVISYPQYRMELLKHTAYIDFRYSIKYKDLIDLEILQSMQLLRMN